MYAKLYSRITESSIIEEPVMVRWVFVGMLAIAEVDGTVIGTDIAISRRLNVTVEEFLEALKVLMAPDPKSNNMDYEGRRVIESPNERGYFLTSYEKYRTLQTKEMRREYMKEYMANKRLNQKDDLLTTPKLTESLQSLPVNSVRQGEGEGEATKKEKELKVLELVNNWNLNEQLPKCVVVTPKRKRSIELRFADQFFVENWFIALRKIKESDFCNGKNDRGWKPDIDWFIRPDSVAKIIEGKYDNRKNSNKDSCI